MKSNAVYFLTGIGASLAVGLITNLVTGIGIDHGVATFLAVAAIDVILLVVYNEQFYMQVRTLIFPSIGITAASAYFILFYS